MKNRNLKHKNEWKTPKSLYDKLNKEFDFEFDPCPLCYDEITPDKDGLLIPWGKSNFINPPYSRALKEGFIKRAIAESKKGSVCVMLLPVSTSTNIFHKYILPNTTDIRFVKGRVKFEGINTKGEMVKTKCGMHDSMIVVFRQAHHITTAIQNCFATSYEQ